jgi:hypothetical protein
MKMFRINKIEKLAGVTVPSDPKSWPTEIMKTLVSQHPYIDTTNVKLNFEQVEPDSNTSNGKIVVANKIVLPFFIRKNDDTRQTELDPIDIIFTNDRYGALTEESYIEAMDSEGVARTQRDGEDVPSKNKYIGQNTGDVSPLEFSNRGGGGGSRMVTAGQGLLSYVVQNIEDVSKLQNCIQTYRGVNSALEAMGLRLPLEEMAKGMIEGTPKTSRLAHVIRMPHGGFGISFDDGEIRVIEVRDLQKVLQEDFYPIMRQVASRGWAMVRDFPTVISADVTPLEVTAPPINIGGPYRVLSSTGEQYQGLVATECMEYDGTTRRIQNFLGTCGEYSTGMVMSGFRLPDDSHHVTPASVIDTGVNGCFFDEAFGSAKCTPSFKIKTIVTMPGEPTSMIVCLDGTGETIGLVPAVGVLRPRVIDKPAQYLPQKSYWVPAHMNFFEIKKKVKIVDRAEQRADGMKAILQKNAGAYHIHGNVTGLGKLDVKDMDPCKMRTKLAWLGGDDTLLDKAMRMKSGESMPLYTLRPAKIQIKTASKNPSGPIGTPAMWSRLKIAAEQVIKSVDETKDVQDDPQIMDSALSLQLINSDNLDRVIDAEPNFLEVEDKLARMLVSARAGEASINEKGVSRALKGMGDAIRSLKTLRMAMEDRKDL